MKVKLKKKKKYLLKKKQNTKKQKCRLLFDLYDFDKNKQITFNEFIVLVKTTLTALNIMVGKKEIPTKEA